MELVAITIILVLLLFLIFSSVSTENLSNYELMNTINNDVLEEEEEDLFMSSMKTSQKIMYKTKSEQKNENLLIGLSNLPIKYNFIKTVEKSASSSNSDSGPSSSSNAAAGGGAPTTTRAVGENYTTTNPVAMVQSIELHEKSEGIPGESGSHLRPGGDGSMNINEIQLWRLSGGYATNVARTGTASLVQGFVDRYFAYLGGIAGINNDKLSITAPGQTVPAGFQLHTVPPSLSQTHAWNGVTYGPTEYPIIRITLQTPVPYNELLSTVIFNRTNCCTGRLGKDLVILRDTNGEVISQIELPDFNSVASNQMNNEPKYVRVDYKPESSFTQFTTNLVSEATSKIMNTTATTIAY